uniref:Uncharacterized protein n=2 Tax=Tetranychus urticae TaxID=32264 RepID=T1JR49_TETUR
MCNEELSVIKPGIEFNSMPTEPDFVPTSWWLKQQRIWINNQIVNWRLNKSDFFTFLAPNMLRLTDNFGRIGDVMYYDLLKKLGFPPSGTHTCGTKLTWRHIFMEPCENLKEIKLHYGITDINLEKKSIRERIRILHALFTFLDDLEKYNDLKKNGALII